MSQSIVQIQHLIWWNSMCYNKKKFPKNVLAWHPSFRWNMFIWCDTKQIAFSYYQICGVQISSLWDRMLSDFCAFAEMSDNEETLKTSYALLSSQIEHMNLFRIRTANKQHNIETINTDTRPNLILSISSLWFCSL